MKSAVSVAGLCAAPFLALGAAVDVHCHLVTDDYRAFLAKHDALLEDGFPLPDWDEAAHLAFMDEAGIAVSVLTLASPHPFFGDAGESADVIRRINDVCAEAKRRHPERFRWCAALPLPDVPAALEEMRRAFDERGADGVKLASNSRGQYLGSPELEPLMAELDRRGAVVVIHPHNPAAMPEGPFTTGPSALFEYPVDTTRAVLNLVAAGIPSRYPNIRWIIPHGGSFLPAALRRFQAVYPLFRARGMVGDVDFEAMRNVFYYDLAGLRDAAALADLLTLTDADHLLYGSDFPFVAAPIAEKHLAVLKALSAESNAPPFAADALFYGNAARLFGLPPSSEQTTIIPIDKQGDDHDDK